MEQNKQCQNCGQHFAIVETDRKYYQEMKVPEPTWCPDCRQQRRLAWRNERTLYKRKCDATGEEIVSVFSPEKAFPVYRNDYWYGDKWNALDYGQDYDFNRPFFEQFEELMNKVPQVARSAVNNQNSDFVNQCGWCKNCYLIFEADGNENCYYSNNIYDSKICMDMLTVLKCELCYECIDCQKCYNLKFSQDCQNCSDSWFLKSCIGCRNCWGCVNMRNKEYHFLNQKYSKANYKKKIESLNLKTYSDLAISRQNFAEFIKKFPQKYMEGVQNEDSTGNYMSNTQRCQNCFDINHCQDCKYVFNSRNMKKCYDITVFGAAKGAEFCYENHEIGESTRNVCFSDQVWLGCSNIFYSKLCLQSSHDLFGCVGLKHNSYCIFNKQYKEQEYEQLRSRIVEHMKKTGEWGQFFPASMSPFAYNETIAQYYYPLKKEGASEKGFKWKDPDPQEYRKQTYQVPTRIEDVSNMVVNEILACRECEKNYKIVPEELKFYRRSQLPIPAKCPDCRHKARFELRNPRKLCQRECQKCKKEIMTTFTPERPEIIYCEKCFQTAMT